MNTRLVEADHSFDISPGCIAEHVIAKAGGKSDFFYMIFKAKLTWLFRSWLEEESNRPPVNQFGDIPGLLEDIRAAEAQVGERKTNKRNRRHNGHH